MSDELGVWPSKNHQRVVSVVAACKAGRRWRGWRRPAAIAELPLEQDKGRPCVLSHHCKKPRRARSEGSKFGNLDHTGSQEQTQHIAAETNPRKILALL